MAVTAQPLPPAVVALLARLVGPLSLATQDAVRRWGLAIDADAAPGAEETLVDRQAETLVAGATLCGPWGASLVTRSPAGPAQFGADQPRAAAFAGATTPVADAVGVAVAAAHGLAAESTAARPTVAARSGADLSATGAAPPADASANESGAPASRGLVVTLAEPFVVATPTRSPVVATPPASLGDEPLAASRLVRTATSPIRLSDTPPPRRAGEAMAQADAADTAPPAFVDFTPEPLSSTGESRASLTATQAATPPPRPETGAAAVAKFDGEPGAAPPPLPVVMPVVMPAALASTSAPILAAVVAAVDQRQRPFQLAPGQAEVIVVAPHQPLENTTVVAESRQLPLPAQARPAAGAAAGADGAVGLDVVAAPTSAAVASTRLPPGVLPAPSAAATGQVPAAMIRLRPAPAPMSSSGGPAPADSAAVGVAAAYPAAYPAALGSAAAAIASPATLTAAPVIRAVAARLDRALAPVFDRALAASGSAFESADQPMAADPSGAAPTQVSNTFNVKVALAGNAAAGDLRQIEDAVADWLRDSARRQGLIG